MQEPSTDPMGEQGDSRPTGHRRVQQAPVYLDRKRAARRHATVDRRSEVFERMYLERLAAMRAQISLLEHQRGA